MVTIGPSLGHPLGPRRARRAANQPAAKPRDFPAVAPAPRRGPKMTRLTDPPWHDRGWRGVSAIDRSMGFLDSIGVMTVYEV